MDELDYDLVPIDSCEASTITNFKVQFHKSLSLINVNMRSLKANFNKLTTFLSQLPSKPSVIVVTETWLDDNTVHLYRLQDYKMLFINRGSAGGGIVLYYRDSINAKIVPKYTQIFQTHESLCVSISLPTIKNLKILCL